jgi:hypothetical protein
MLQILGADVQNLFSWATMCSGCLHLCCYESCTFHLSHRLRHLSLFLNILYNFTFSQFLRKYFFMYIVSFGHTQKGPRNFICGGPNLSTSFLPGLRSNHIHSLLINKGRFRHGYKNQCFIASVCISDCPEDSSTPKTEVTYRQAAKF